MSCHLCFLLFFKLCWILLRLDIWRCSCICRHLFLQVVEDDFFFYSSFECDLLHILRFLSLCSFSFSLSSPASLSLPYIAQYCVGRGATVLYCGLSGVGVCLVNATALRVKGQPADQGGVRVSVCVGLCVRACVCVCKVGSEKTHASTRGDCNNTPGTPQDNTHSAFTPLSPVCLSLCLGSITSLTCMSETELPSIFIFIYNYNNNDSIVFPSKYSADFKCSPQ